VEDRLRITDPRFEADRGLAVDFSRWWNDSMSLVALESSPAPSSPQSDIARVVTVSGLPERRLKAEDLA
jgi:hypothetical protein